VDSHGAGGSKGDFDGIVVRLRDTEKEFVGSQEDRLEFIELSVFGEAGGGDLDKVSNVVLRRGMAVFVCLLRHCNTALDELCFDTIPKSVGYHVRTERGTRNDNSCFEFRSKTNAESVRRGVPKSVNTRIDSHLHRGESGQLVQSLC